MFISIIIISKPLPRQARGIVLAVFFLVLYVHGRQTKASGKPIQVFLPCFTGVSETDVDVASSYGGRITR